MNKERRAESGFSLFNISSAEYVQLPVAAEESRVIVKGVESASEEDEKGCPMSKEESRRSDECVRMS